MPKENWGDLTSDEKIKDLWRDVVRLFAVCNDLLDRIRGLRAANPQQADSLRKRPKRLCRLCSRKRQKLLDGSV